MPDAPPPLDLDAILRRPEGDTMTSPITPDERAAVRKHAEVGHSLWPAEVLRLLDALDTAEAEVARLRAAHTHCDQEVYAETWNAGYENAMAQGLADDPALADDWLVEHDERVRRAAEAERDEARAASARVHEAAARVVADEAAESDLTITRQRDRLRAREEQVRRLRAEVLRLHALVADLRATTAPAWDEEATRVALVDAQLASVQQVMEDGYPSIFVRSNEDAADVALAVVRDNQPVKPRRETVRDEIAGHPIGSGYYATTVGVDEAAEIADAVLSLLPGRSEAEVKEEALREARDAVRASSFWADGSDNYADRVRGYLSARAERLAAGAVRWV